MKILAKNYKEYNKDFKFASRCSIILKIMSLNWLLSCMTVSMISDLLQTYM